MSVINNELTCLAVSTDWLRAAQRPSAIGVVDGVQSNATQLNSTGCRRGVQSDSTHNSTQLDVELCRYKRGLSVPMLTNICRLYSQQIKSIKT